MFANYRFPHISTHSESGWLHCKAGMHTTRSPRTGSGPRTCFIRPSTQFQ